jgi:hypothetical protein
MSGVKQNVHTNLMEKLTKGQLKDNGLTVVRLLLQQKGRSANVDWIKLPQS